MNSLEHELGMLIPIGVSGWAIAAGYAGLFSLIILPGPLALVLGIIAVVHLKKRPDLRGLVRAWLGIVLGGMATALLLFSIVAVLVTP